MNVPPVSPVVAVEVVLGAVRNVPPWMLLVALVLVDWRGILYYGMLLCVLLVVAAISFPAAAIDCGAALATALIEGRVLATPDARVELARAVTAVQALGDRLAAADDTAAWAAAPDRDVLPSDAAAASRAVYSLPGVVRAVLCGSGDGPRRAPGYVCVPLTLPPAAAPRCLVIEFVHPSLALLARLRVAAALVRTIINALGDMRAPMRLALVDGKFQLTAP